MSYCFKTFLDGMFSQTGHSICKILFEQFLWYNLIIASNPVIVWVTVECIMEDIAQFGYLFSSAGFASSSIEIMSFLLFYCDFV